MSHTGTLALQAFGGLSQLPLSGRSEAAGEVRKRTVRIVSKWVALDHLDLLLSYMKYYDEMRMHLSREVYAPVPRRRADRTRSLPTAPGRVAPPRT